MHGTGPVSTSIPLLGKTINKNLVWSLIFAAIACLLLFAITDSCASRTERSPDRKDRKANE